jgi:tryptophanyl-tRNA synthetase
VATPLAQRLRRAVGLRSLADLAPAPTPATDVKAARPMFKQYREADGRFYFKLTDAKGHLLLQSTGFESPRQAGQAVARLKAEGWAACADLHEQVAAHTDAEQVEAALALLRDA